MSDDPQSPPPGWSQEQPPPFRPGDAADGWGPATPGQASPGPTGGGPGDPPVPGGPGSAWAPPPPAPKPGVIPLRPLMVGDIMTGAIDYVRREPKTVITISAMVGVVAAFVQLGVLAATSSDLAEVTSSDPSQIDPAELVPLLVTLLGLVTVSAAVAGVLQIFGTGMLTHVMGRAVVGQRTSVGQAWVLVRPQLWRLIAATLVVGLVVGLAIAVPVAPGLVLLSSGLTVAGAVLTLLGSLVAMVLGVWLTFGLILTTPALALEDCGPIAAMKRSWRLVRGGFWRTLGIVLVGSIVGQAVGSIAASPFSLLGGAGAELTTMSVFGLAIAGLVTTMVALPFVAGVTALVYIDRRIRTENLAAVLAASAEGLSGQ